jgi:hypothetical protein
MAPKTSFDLDVGYMPDKTPLTVVIPLTASEQDIEEIKEMMVRAFAQTESVPDSVMKTLLAQTYRHTQTANHHYIQWTRIHTKADEMYPNRLMQNLKVARQ